jgi:hypothetical protein
MLPAVRQAEGGMADHSDWSIERGLRTADQEIEAFRSAVLGQGPVAVERLASVRQQAFRAEIGGALCILRVVSHVRPAASERHTNAFHRLARTLSPARMSSPAVLTRFAETHSGVPANTDIVVTEHAPPTYLDSEKMARGTLRRVESEARHLGAILSYIAHLADHGLRRNLLFSSEGAAAFPYWFIDLDFAFGDTMSWGYGRPIFYPGRQMNYQAMDDISRLPPRAAQLLDWIERLPRREIARGFGLSRIEATDLQNRCAKLKRLGLAAAIEREHFWGPESDFFTRWKERTRGTFAKALTTARALRA